MVELKTYRRHEVPREMACQIRSYARIQWPYVHGRLNRIWDYTPAEDNPVHFLLVDEEVLVSHASVNHRPVEVGNDLLKVYGLSTVFTYPAFRKSGYAAQVVQAATDHIRQSDADLAMLFTGQPLRTFYTDCGWEPVDTAKIYYGEKENPTLKDDNLVMMLFVSPKGNRAQEILSRQAVYVGKQTW
jgi:GNAT superfamily N-acetyltransferase